MTPSTAISILDRAIARDGQTVTIARNDGSALQTVKAVVRGYQPRELTGDITQGDRKMVLSPTSLVFVPLKTDLVTIHGVACSIISLDETQIQDATVRYDLSVRG